MQYDNSTTLDPAIAARLKRDDKGLVAAVVVALLTPAPGRDVEALYDEAVAASATDK